MRSEICVVRLFRRCGKVHLNKTRYYNTAYYTFRLYGIAILPLIYKPVQHVTVLNTVGNCNTLVIIIT